ncbi:RWD-domain-containing protein [Cristinia sonorae]|uniref:RWD-domain-containing protein n=1 Tax=Cristinia sonorae TaxID=1940300 RepID=A0A8K0ULP1_9AGAR|nr:RWD-domain-containing protein [Cristinia sonorae]
MSSDVLLEEFEVLESIYPTELSKLSEKEIRIDVEPEEPAEDLEPLLLALNVVYPDEYPDVLPELSLEATEGELTDEEMAGLLKGMKTVGEENMGMAMTFTLVSHLREELSALVRKREEQRKHEESEKERLAIEAEEARTRGTPVTLESFKAWKAKFDKEMARRREREEDEKLKGLTPKERDEVKKLATRLSGRQLFERNKDLATSDDSLLEEDTVSVDISQYDRDAAHDDDEDDDKVTFSDSD